MPFCWAWSHALHPRYVSPAILKPFSVREFRGYSHVGKGQVIQEESFPPPLTASAVRWLPLIFFSSAVT